jgi:hypothetical protein
MSEFTVDMAVEMMNKNANSTVKNNVEHSSTIGQATYDSVMTSFGAPKEDRTRVLEAQGKVMEATFHFHTNQLIDGIKTAVKESKNPKEVTQSTNIRMDKDVFSVRSNAYTHGEITVRDDKGENVKKPWEKYGKTTFNMNVERRFSNDVITQAQEKVKRSFDD